MNGPEIVGAAVVLFFMAGLASGIFMLFDVYTDGVQGCPDVEPPNGRWEYYGDFGERRWISYGPTYQERMAAEAENRERDMKRDRQRFEDKLFEMMSARYENMDPRA